MIPGSAGVIDYVKAVKELHLKINQNFADENMSTTTKAGGRL
jgi:hypothetical protein